MNIAQAKEEIRRTLLAYHRKDEDGNYVYPISQQRPLLLMGPPGIGKSAVLEQVAHECSVGLVSYTMTHHTRQSAIGLPRITEQTFEGEKVVLTEYTLSEIIASIYRCMQQTGCREGILFIDEINCVSETLTPVMLSLLQNKRFGMHRVPDGWMIVAAGNPPAYNRSAREFDIVTMDRVRRLDIEPDLQVWMAYAAQRGVHSAVISYLQLHPEHFYEALSHSGERHFVTARGWEDLSALMVSYEALGMETGDDQVMQFLGEEKIARSFASYLRIYRKYGGDYGIDRILDGSMPEDERQEKEAMADKGSFEERMTVTALLTGALGSLFVKEDHAYHRHAALDTLKERCAQSLACGEGLEALAQSMDQAAQIRIKQETMTAQEEQTYRCQVHLLRLVDEKIRLCHITGKEGSMQILDEELTALQYQMQLSAQAAGAALGRAIAFCEEAFGEDQEMMLLITGLARNPLVMRHITQYGCEAFLRWVEKLGLAE